MESTCLGAFVLLIYVALFGLGVLGTIFWIWMLIDCVTKESSEGNDRVVWVIIIIFTHLLGAIIYFFVRRRKRLADVGT